MPSVTSSVHELCGSIVSIFFGLFASFLAVFNAILALGRDMASATMKLGQAVFNAAIGITGGVVELIWANVFGIAVCVGGYYLYTAYVQKRPTRGKKRAA